jgi:hypothetical protein
MIDVKGETGPTTKRRNVKLRNIRTSIKMNIVTIMRKVASSLTELVFQKAYI